MRQIAQSDREPAGQAVTDGGADPAQTSERWWTALGAALGALGAGAMLFGPGPRRAPETGLLRPAAPARVLAAPTPPEARLPAREPPGAPAQQGGGDARPAAAPGAGRSFDCMLSAFEEVEVGSAVRGTLREVYVERGDRVEPGQLLASLDWNTERAALDLAQARADRTSDLRVSAEQARLRDRQRQRAITLHERDSLSLEMRELAETEARIAALEHERAREDEHQALLQLEQARVALQRRMIVSPIAGVVVERMLSRGELVDDEPILRIARIDRLRAEVILPSSLFATLAPGDRAEIMPEPPYDQPRPAEVLITDPIIDGASGTFGVRLGLPNRDLRLPGGLRCQARFAAASR
jgi:RND family efflux transporter MFP subunit